MFFIKFRNFKPGLREIYEGVAFLPYRGTRDLQLAASTTPFWMLLTDPSIPITMLGFTLDLPGAKTARLTVPARGRDTRGQGTVPCYLSLAA